MTQQLVVCGKSPWAPSIRREHAFARQAVARGIATTFVESPSDLRALRDSHFRGWIRDLSGHDSERDGVRTTRRSSPAPGHRHRLAAKADNALLRRILRAQPPITSLVVNAPWQWEATAGLACRRVFDAADDWTLLIPARAQQLRRYYKRIAAEADGVIVANPALAHLFGDRATCVVPNAVDPTLLVGTPSARPRRNRLVYVGTLSERFDVALVGRVLNELSDWSLDLYGECRYEGSGDRPSAALQELLDVWPGQVRWHGLVPRAHLGAVIDWADVFVLPNRPEQAAGQSSMKAFDCAARGRPMVTTPWPDEARDMLPPHTYEAQSAQNFAGAILAAASEPAGAAQARCDWASEQTWDARWPSWAAAVGLEPALVSAS